MPKAKFLAKHGSYGIGKYKFEPQQTLDVDADTAAALRKNPRFVVDGVQGVKADYEPPNTGEVDGPKPLELPVKGFAAKKDAAAFAKLHFEVDLDTTKALPTLNREVAALFHAKFGGGTAETAGTVVVTNTALGDVDVGQGVPV